MKLDINGTENESIPVNDAIFLHTHLNNILMYKLRKFSIGQPQTFSIGRGIADIISVKNLAEIIMQILPVTFKNLKLVYEQLKKQESENYKLLIFSIIAWLKTFVVWLLETDEGGDFWPDFLEKLFDAFSEKPTDFFSKLTIYLSNGNDLKNLMELIRKLSAKIKSATQNELLHQTTLNLFKLDWLGHQANNPAVNESVKTLLTFSSDKFDTIENMYYDGIRPVLDDDDPERKSDDWICFTKSNVPIIYKTLFLELLNITRKKCRSQAVKHPQRFLESWNDIG